MGSEGGVYEVSKKAMWLYPKAMGFNPTERWGHSSCYSDGYMYVFGGCCGGLHFSDVIVLNLHSMVWSVLATTGQGPGPRDSHSVTLFGHLMLVFGGTNGSKKVNDLHVLDLRSRVWSQPNCKGQPPSPRESHTATLVGEDKLVIFGGSGEGDSNYLNDVHVLDLKAMRWASPQVNSYVPTPRDSHSAVAIGSKVFVYGGDCGDRYEGKIDMLDVNTMTWARLEVKGSSPGVRAGHASIGIGTKVFIIGGVGDKQYYNDVWFLDVSTGLWTLLDQIRGQKPQGRFSHTTVVAETDIVIYGGCGEDEHPVNELLVLQLGTEHPNGRYNISLCKIFGNRNNQEKGKVSGDAGIKQRHVLGNDRELTRSETCGLDLGSKRCLDVASVLPENVHSKRKRISNSRVHEIESEPEEHSLSLSQHSSPSQSDQEQAPIKKAVAAEAYAFYKQKNRIPSNQVNYSSFLRKNSQGSSPNPEPYLRAVPVCRPEAQYPATQQTVLDSGTFQSMVGAEVRGKIDGGFDSGYLMTAVVNGKIFRGVLFPPGPEVVSRGVNLDSNAQPLSSHRPSLVRSQMNQSGPTHIRSLQQQPPKRSEPEPGKKLHQSQMTRPSQFVRATPASITREPNIRSDLQGVVLTLGGPGSM